MTLRQYLVKVHCCGSRWLIEVPAVGRWTPVNDKRAITETAKAMISAITGAALGSFGVDLAEDRVVANIDEYAAEAPSFQRWDGAPAMAGPPDAA